METIILSISNGEEKYSSTSASNILENVLDQISEELGSLVATIEGSIPLAIRGCDHGKTLATRLLKENVKLHKLKAETPLWKALLDTRTWSGQQLARDLELTSESVKTITIISMKLEDIRAAMVTFRNNLVLFKVRSIINCH